MLHYRYDLHLVLVKLASNGDVPDSWIMHKPELFTSLNLNSALPVSDNEIKQQLVSVTQIDS